jgi:hypothetical protein
MIQALLLSMFFLAVIFNSMVFGILTGIYSSKLAVSLLESKMNKLIKNNTSRQDSLVQEFLTT